MTSSTTYRKDAIRPVQNRLLYESVVFSAVGSIAAAFVVVATFSPYSHMLWLGTWQAIITSVYLARYVDYRLYRRSATRDSNSRLWAIRFNVGALLASLAWSSSLWLVFPADDLPHQVLLILMLGGVAGGALASLPYDRRLNLVFQSVIVILVEVRLLLDGSAFSLELALFSLFVFCFLLSCGEKVGRNYIELLRLKQDAQESNLTLIRTTERMARTGYWQWDGSSRTVELSENLALMWGFRRRRVPIRDCFRMLHRDDRRRVRRTLASVLERAEETAVEHRIVKRGGGQISDMRQVVKPLLDSQDHVSWLGTVQDISDIRTAEETIYKMAYYDELTGLANRANFHERLQATIDEATRRDQEFCVIYIDLDDFKGVNDSYGHECGDHYLKAFADHLAGRVRRAGVTARLGGDEFCVLLPDTRSDEEAGDTAECILEFSRTPVQIGNHRIYPKLSIGIARFPRDGRLPDQIVKNADLAMYNVKRNGKHHVAFYDPKMSQDSLETARLESDFRTALVNGEFELWYQPQIDLTEDRISGVEALIRWRHPQLGIVAPDVFIGVAERVGMINDIGAWVVRTACEQLAHWKVQGYRLQMAVNISGMHFTSDGFCDLVGEIARDAGVEDGELEIEITESLSRDPEEHYRICRELSLMGIRVAIDDFGTGYSSLSVLQKLEIDTLKIDRSFINGLPQEKSARLLVNAMVEISVGLGYDLVAEGVETREQLDYLRTLKCSHAQGYLFSRPVKPELIPGLIDAGDHRRFAA